MKGKFKNKLIVFFLALAALFVFSGCSLTQTLESVKENYDLSPQVTYYSNGGVFEDSSVKKEMFYKVGGKAMNIGFVKVTSSHKPTIKRDGYKFLGWYYVELDNGEPVFENGESGAYKLTEEVDFTKALQEDEHWIIAAKWQALVGVKVMMVCEEGKTVEVDEGKSGLEEGRTSFVNGDEIGELNYDSKDIVTLSSTTQAEKFFTVKDRAFTFLGYYMDEACLTPAPSSLSRGEQDIVIYAKYLTGDWNFVSTKSQVSAMFSGLGQGKNYWLLNDVDCNNATVAPIINFKGALQGNGYTIRNLKVLKTLDTTNPKSGVFGNLTATAKIENVTFENVNVEYKLKTAGLHAETYFVFLSKEAGAVVNNVTMKGTLSANGPTGSVVDNLVDGTGTPRYDHCLYGGYEKDSDYTDGGFNVILTKINDYDVENQ